MEIKYDLLVGQDIRHYKWIGAWLDISREVQGMFNTSYLGCLLVLQANWFGHYICWSRYYGCAQKKWVFQIQIHWTPNYQYFWIPIQYSDFEFLALQFVLAPLYYSVAVPISLYFPPPKSDDWKKMIFILDDIKKIIKTRQQMPFVCGYRKYDRRKLNKFLITFLTVFWNLPQDVWLWTGELDTGSW